MKHRTTTDMRLCPNPDEYIRISHIRARSTKFYSDLKFFNMSIKQFISTKAFIVHQDKVLILREADAYEDGYNAGTYEIPGGRVEFMKIFKSE